MKHAGLVLGAVVAAAVVAAPMESAQAHEWHRHGGFIFGPVGAIVAGAATIAAAPFVALGAAVAPRPYYYPPPAYAYPAPAYYAPPPRPAYYAAPPAYYAPPGYYYPGR